MDQTTAFEQSSHDPVVFGLVAAVLLGVTVAASWLPAVRAARADPPEAQGGMRVR